MNFWNKITIGAKFLFGGWESALDYLLGFLNDYLAKPNIAENAKKVYDTASWAVSWFSKLENFVPQKWHNEYASILHVALSIVDVAADGQISSDEINDLVEAFKIAKAKWDEDDEPETK